MILLDYVPDSLHVSQHDVLVCLKAAVLNLYRI